MHDLRIPLDVEQRPEIWQLRNLLRDKQSRPQPLTKIELEQAVAFLVFRLFILLGYQAQSTNKPGFLSKTGAAQYLESLDPLYADDTNPIELMMRTEPPFLKEVEGGWMCELFAARNSHLAGNFRSPAEKGNLSSRLKAALDKFPEEVDRQAMLFGPEQAAAIFRNSNGEVLSEPDIKRVLFLVRALDRCLMQSSKVERLKASLTPGFVASCYRIIATYAPNSMDELKPFMYWLNENHTHPSLPKTAEEIVEKFETYWSLSKES